MSYRSVGGMPKVRRLSGLGAALLALSALAAGGAIRPNSATAADRTVTTTATNATIALTAKQTTKLKLGYANPLGGTDPQSAAIQGGAACYASKVDGTFTATAAGDDLNKQISDIDALIAQGVNGIVLIPLDPGGLSGAYQQAKSAHIKTVAILPQSVPGTTGSVIYNFNDFGQLAAKWVKAHVPKAKALVIGGTPGVPTADAIVQGFITAAKADGIRILARQNSQTVTQEDGQNIAEAMLATHPDANVIYAISEPVAIGAGLAVQQQGTKVAVFAGSGGTQQGQQGVKSGTITAFNDAQLFEVGFAAAKLTNELLDGQTGASSVSIEPVTYDKSNIAKFVPPQSRCAGAKP